MRVQLPNRLTLLVGVFLASIFLFVDSPTSLHAQNLIQNPNCSSAGPANWNNVANVDCQTVTFPNAPTSGQEGAQYFATENTGTGSVEQTIAGLTGGATFDFEVYIATFDGADTAQDGIIVELQFQDGTGSNVGSPVTLVDTDANGSYPTSSSWERRRTTDITTPSGTEQAVLTANFARSSGGGFVDTFLDAFSLVQTSAPPSNTPPTASGTISPTALDDNAGPTALFADIDVSDPDPGENDLTLRVTSSTASAGVITGTGGTSVTNEGGGVFSVDGSFDQSTIDTALDNLRFEPTDNTSDSGTFNTDLTVQVDDQDSGFVDVSGPTTATITRINDAPTLTDGSPFLDAIDEDAGDDDGDGTDGDDDATNNNNNPGTTVATLLSRTGGTSDVDSSPLGLAVVGIDNTNGTYQFSTDGGTSFSDFSGAEATDSATLLAEDGLVRFVPDADYNGSTTGGITFKAWDQFAGSNGQTGIDTTPNGGNGSGNQFSSTTDTAGITVNAVNDAPTISTNTGSTVDEGTNATISQSELEATDPEQGASSLTYTIDTDVAEGELVNTNTSVQLDQSDTFTQDDINSGFLQYQHTGALQNDSFAFTVSDGDGGTASGTFSITVTNLPPEFNSPATASVPENTTGLVLDVDADDGGTGANDEDITYTLGGPDSGPFSINASNGELTLDVARDFENPTDSNGDNVYEVEVTADDGESANNTATQSIAITVTDIPAPTATTDAATNITTTAADLNGTVNPNGAETTVEFTYYPTDTPSNTTTVAADESPVSGSNDTAVSTSISGLTPGVEYGYTMDATSGEGAATGSAVTFTTTGVPDADVFAETTPRTEIPNGDTFDYGDVEVGSAEPQTFSVENNGSSDLIIDVGNITTSGSNDFQITSFPGSATVAPGDAESFEVTYTPSSLGPASFSVSVPSNDPNDNPYVVTLEGTGTNTAPTISSISDQTIEEDATLGPISFTVGDDQTDASNLDVTATSDDQTLVPDANITLGGSGTDRTLELTPESNESGTATITVTVDDTSGEPNATASTSFTLTVNAVPDLSITDGSTAGLDFTASVSPGTDNNPIGILALSADQAGASFEELTATNLAPGVAGISTARLFWSDDTTLEPGTDTELASVTVDDQSAPSSILFDGFSEPVSSTTGYAILAIDVEPGATDGGVQFELSQPADLTVTDGEIATVNGASNTSFAALPLSNDATALPVEFAGINVQRSSAQGITIEWETLSELNNAGFEVQRAEGGAEAAPQSDASWTTLTTVEGAGTTDEAQSYAFTDTAPPYAADSLTYRLRQLDADGTASFSEAVTVALQTTQPELLPAYPNPTRGQATIRFAVPEQKAVRLTLYDIMGRRVRTLMEKEVEGRTETPLRLDDLASGTYFLRMQTDGYTDTQRITVVR